jgi:hypothetical protein
VSSHHCYPLTLQDTRNRCPVIEHFVRLCRNSERGLFIRRASRR